VNLMVVRKVAMCQWARSQKGVMPKASRDTLGSTLIA
jgi:hypothetical protein